MVEFESVPSEQEGIFIPKEQELAYCEEHRIDMRKLDNGALLVGVPHFVEDQARADIHVSFPSGAMADPVRKEGIHHLLEHLMMKQLAIEGPKYHCGKNGLTTATSMAFMLSGSANPTVLEYGVWPMLPVLYESLAYPLENISDFSAALENERSVVAGEIVEKNVQEMYPQSRAKTFYDSIVLSSDHPSHIEALGTLEALSSITEADLIDLSHRVFSPDNMIISAYTQGEDQILQKITDIQEQYYAQFPTRGVDANVLPANKGNTLNPKLQMGDVYSVDTGFNNGGVNAVFTWRFPYQEYSRQAAALNSYVGDLHNKFFLYARQNGWGYSGGASKNVYENEVLVNIEMFFGKTGDPLAEVERRLSEIQGNVFSTYTNEDFEYIRYQDSLAKRANPITRIQRYNLLRDGINKYQRIIDADRLLAVSNSVIPSDISAWNSKLQEIRPAVILAGELS